VKGLFEMVVGGEGVAEAEFVHEHEADAIGEGHSLSACLRTFIGIPELKFYISPRLEPDSLWSCVAEARVER
jgi:hypothetical protein